MEQAEGSKSNNRDLPIIWTDKFPAEVSFDILSRLPVTSLLQCKLVSHLWNASVKHPQLALTHLSHAAEHDPSLVIFSSWPKSKLQLLHLSDDDTDRSVLKTLNLPFQLKLLDFEVIGSSNGLLCLCSISGNGLLCLCSTSGNLPVFVYNPFFSQFRELPRVVSDRPESDICRVVFGFGFHWRTREYKMIKIVYYNQRQYDFRGGDPEAFVLTLGEAAEWRNLGKIELGIAGPTSEALVKGKFHWLGLCGESNGVRYRDIISFDLETEQFGGVPRPDSGELNWNDYHLVELRGRLSAVVPVSGGTNEIWVMKEYGAKESWTRELRVGNFVPRGNPWHMMPPSRATRNGSLRRGFRVVCGLKSGEILFVHSSRCLACFDPCSGEFKELEFDGLPLDFQAFVHFGSIISVAAL